jgi:hypothetical protein
VPRLARRYRASALWPRRASSAMGARPAKPRYRLPKSARGSRFLEHLTAAWRSFACRLLMIDRAAGSRLGAARNSPPYSALLLRVTIPSDGRWPAGLRRFTHHSWRGSAFCGTAHNVLGNWVGSLHGVLAPPCAVRPGWARLCGARSTGQHAYCSDLTGEGTPAQHTLPAGAGLLVIARARSDRGRPMGPTHD